MSIEKFKALEQKYLNLFNRGLPKLIANLAELHFKNSFKNGGFTDRSFQPWRKTKGGKQNVFGEPGAGILLRSSNLRDSISVQTAKNGVVRIVSGNAQIQYAQIHNEGGTISMAITPKMRRFFWAMYKTTELDMWKYMALKKDNLNIKIPKRQFIGNSEILNKDIDKLISRKVKELERIKD